MPDDPRQLLRARLGQVSAGEVPLTDDVLEALAELFGSATVDPGFGAPLQGYWDAPHLTVSAATSGGETVTLIRIDLDTGEITTRSVSPARRWPRALLLVRHGKHEAFQDAPEPGEFLHGEPRRLTKEGGQETVDVADYLAGFVFWGDDPALKVAAIRYAPSWEAKATAERIAQSLTRNRGAGEHTYRPRALASLDPGHTSHYSTSAQIDALAAELAALAVPPPQVLGEANDKAYEFFTENRRFAAIVVGHQPLLGWLAHRITGAPVPIQQSEILCLALDGAGGGARVRGRLDWVLSPSDPAAMEELKAKIRSKMDTAKVLSVFITAGFGFVIKAIADLENGAPSQAWGYPIAAALFLAAIVLYLSSMYSYDSLLMPRRFWAEGSPEAARARPSWIVARPPSPAHWVLYQNMLRIWNRQFTPATILVLLGLLVLAYSVMPFSKLWPIRSAVAFGIVGILAFVAARTRAAGRMRRHFGPWIGSED